MSLTRFVEREAESALVCVVAVPNERPSAVLILIDNPGALVHPTLVDSRTTRMEASRRGGLGGGDHDVSFQMTSMIVTSSQTYSVQFKSVVLCSQFVLPCRSRSANQPSADCCLEVTTQA